MWEERETDDAELLLVNMVVLPVYLIAVNYYGQKVLK